MSFDDRWTLALNGEKDQIICFITCVAPLTMYSHSDHICFGTILIASSSQAGRFWQSAGCRAGERCPGGDQDEEFAQVGMIWLWWWWWWWWSRWWWQRWRFHWQGWCFELQIKNLRHPQFEHKQEPAQDQSEGGRPRDGGHSQPYTGDILSDLHHNV